MNIHFRQIYIEPGVLFLFNHLFQKRLSSEVTALVVPSPKYIAKYGEDFDLIFNISAKKNLQENDIRGPGVYRKTKDVEYTVFLPFDVISGLPDVSRHALRYLLIGVRAVFERLEIDTAKVAEKQELLIESICSDPTMFTAKDERQTRFTPQ